MADGGHRITDTLNGCVRELSRLGLPVASCRRLTQLILVTYETDPRDYAMELVKAAEWVEMSGRPEVLSGVQSLDTLFILSANATPEEVREMLDDNELSPRFLEG